MAINFLQETETEQEMEQKIELGKSKQHFKNLNISEKQKQIIHVKFNYTVCNSVLHNGPDNLGMGIEKATTHSQIVFILNSN